MESVKTDAGRREYHLYRFCRLISLWKCFQDYIHRVGRTARAGRSGVAISIVNQYELEWYLQIEKLIDKKLPEYPAEEEEVLLLLERVAEAKRMAQMKIKEGGGGKKRRKGGDDDGEEDINKYLDRNKGKSSKKARRM